MGTGGAVTEVYVIVPRREPSGATAVTMRHGVPVSDALRYDRPSHVPAYLCAGPAPAGARDRSPGAHAANTTATQSVRISSLPQVLKAGVWTPGRRDTRKRGVGRADVRPAGAPASRRPRRTRRRI